MNSKLGLTGMFVIGAAIPFTVAFSLVPTPPPVEESIPVQSFESTASEPVLAERDDFTTTPVEAPEPDLTKVIDAPEYACPDGWFLAEDLSCVNPDYYDEPNTEEPQEDDPSFDCRFHGNEQCGVEIQGTWYVIQFEDGSPESVSLR